MSLIADNSLASRFRRLTFGPILPEGAVDSAKVVGVGGDAPCLAENVEWIAFWIEERPASAWGGGCELGVARSSRKNQKLQV
jgi:hypothetical protein